MAHTTLYGGFLRKDGEASVLDAVDHLEHAIRIMGIDHVGIGTDFDGDGGVRGMADSSELINFTIRLLRRKYSERDIEKIWGNVDKANKVLGWKAEAELGDVLASAWKWQQKLRADGVM